MLIVSFLNPTNEAMALIDVFSLNGILSDIESSSLEDNVITCISLICTGSTNDDIIIGSFLNEEISGLGGDDVIQGNDGDDLIYGGDGSDSIQGGGGIDNIFGQDGDDYIYADSTTSLSSALSGDEVAIVDRLDELLLNIDNEIPVTKIDISIKGNSVSDVFALTSSNMLLFSESYLNGGEGDDHIYGGSGHDVLEGGPGRDFFDCNEGIDSVLDFNPDEDTANVNCEMLQ